MSDSADATPSARRLVLVRHAKAVSDAGGSDRDRALTDRGRQQTAALGSWLATRLDRIDAVWSSSAVRARQTWEGIATHLPAAPKAQRRDDLYDAGPEDLLDIVRSADDDIRVLVVVGHNPTMERALGWITGDERDVATGVAAIIELPGRWSDLQPGSGHLAAFSSSSR